MSRARWVSGAGGATRIALGLAALGLAAACGGAPPPPPGDGELVLRVRVRDDLCPVGGCPGEEPAPPAGPPMCDVPGPSGLMAREIVMGHRFACTLLSDGGVRCWGSNNEGAHGDGGSGRGATPVTARGVERARTLDAGRYHVCAVIDSGVVYCWGRSDHGALGTGDRQRPPGNLPVQVRGVTDAEGVALGFDHSCARDRSGGVRCWGRNHVGQVGDGSRELRAAPSAIERLRVTDIAAGGDSTCAVRTDGAVACWGALTGTERPTAIAGLPQPAVSVAVGDSAACARLVDGTVMCWGNGAYGTLGPAAGSASDTAVRVEGLPPAQRLTMGSTFACIVDGEGQVWCWGSTQTFQSELAHPRLRGGMGRAVDVSVNDEAACAAMGVGGVCCWGRNTSGQLGTQWHPFANPGPEAEWPVPLEW